MSASRRGGGWDKTLPFCRNQAANAAGRDGGLSSRSLQRRLAQQGSACRGLSAKPAFKPLRPFWSRRPAQASQRSDLLPDTRTRPISRGASRRASPTRPAAIARRFPIHRRRICGPESDRPARRRLTVWISRFETKQAFQPPASGMFAARTELPLAPLGSIAAFTDFPTSNIIQSELLRPTEITSGAMT